MEEKIKNNLINSNIKSNFAFQKAQYKDNLHMVDFK